MLTEPNSVTYVHFIDDYRKVQRIDRDVAITLLGDILEVKLEHIKTVEQLQEMQRAKDRVQHPM
jgi:hypothetical protein